MAEINYQLLLVLIFKVTNVMEISHSNIRVGRKCRIYSNVDKSSFMVFCVVLRHAVRQLKTECKIVSWGMLLSEHCLWKVLIMHVPD